MKPRVVAEEKIEMAGCIPGTGTVRGTFGESCSIELKHEQNYEESTHRETSKQTRHIQLSKLSAPGHALI